MSNLGIASDVNNNNFVGATNPDSVMHVKFYMKSVQDSYQSTQQGRPIYKEIPYIQIMTPGNALNIIDTPAREEHKYRFPRHWAIFQNSQTTDEQIVGTPIDTWPMVTRAQAEDMKGMKFYTVEQIAGASDEQIQRLGMNGQMMRQKAKAYLERANESAIANIRSEEIKQRDEKIAALENMVKMLADKIEQKTPEPATIEAPRVKRKYTKRVKQEEPA
jgi:hypothetical protein